MRSALKETGDVESCMRCKLSDDRRLLGWLRRNCASSSYTGMTSLRNERVEHLKTDPATDILRASATGASIGMGMLRVSSPITLVIDQSTHVRVAECPKCKQFSGGWPRIESVREKRVRHSVNFGQPPQSIVEVVVLQACLLIVQRGSTMRAT